ncbi:MAG: hypothetical protein M1426_03510, partial [Patescibacteria group bacterium]|nr:hypothetical protein [Patescibacteria group bacterium]
MLKRKVGKMLNKTTKEKRLKAIGEYTGALILCMLILVWVMKLWNADLAVPFAYGGDALYVSMLIKGLIDNGGYLHNSFVGMPTGLDMHDFPFADSFQFLLMKLISFFVSDYAVILNLYFLLTFPLTTLSSLFVFRQFSISYLSSIVGSLLFTFLPYHFFRGEAIFFLAAYYMIPPMVMVILWVYLERPLLFNYGENNCKPRLDFLSYKSIISVVICMLVASTGIYYAFFACFFLLVAGISAYFNRSNVYHLLASGILIIVISIGVLINISPSIVYKYNYGENLVVARRIPVEAEISGLKITQLLLPVSSHRITYLAVLKDKYNSAPLVNENNSSSLGAVGSFGFLTMIGWFLYRKPVASNMKLIGNLSVLTVSAVLLATIGGFGSLFALIISPQIRAYNRISVYIAFFSLFAVVLIMENFSNKYLK